MLLVEPRTVQELLDKAKETGSMICALRLAWTSPEVLDEKVVIVPAVLLHYSIRFDDESWVFREQRNADRDGKVDLGGTLWAKLMNQKQPPEIPYCILHRSGSF